MTKCGHGGIDADGNYFHEEWEVEESPEDFERRLFAVIASIHDGVMEPTFQIKAKAYAMLKGYLE